MKRFDERLQYLANREKLEQTDLVPKLKKDKSTVSKWWRGEIIPGPKNTRLISDNFKCNYSWLLTGQGEPFPDRYTPPAGDAINLDFGKKEKTDISPNVTKESESIDTLRQYRDLAQMDADTLGEIQTWINDMERMRPGYTAWFRLEFQNRFPEFDEWKSKIIKKQANGNNY